MQMNNTRKQMQFSLHDDPTATLLEHIEFVLFKFEVSRKMVYWFYLHSKPEWCMFIIIFALDYCWGVITASRALGKWTYHLGEISLHSRVSSIKVGSGYNELLPLA